ncbi:hypothetical protein GCM10023081_39580 [Arthrobacter ginkgonis]|uniref:Uncharacterized protein n=1 Tax=Arthrobacter ginkgonis TaxID=1630594 RepID=A0ABP7D227_9MICC
MNTSLTTPIRVFDVSQVDPGDLVEARRGGKMHHRGPAEEAVPALNVLWIFEQETGLRKLIEAGEYEIWARKRADAT